MIRKAHNLATTAAVAATLWAAPVHGQNPDWHSNVLTTPSSQSANSSSGLSTEAIRVTPLDAVKPDAVGILSADQAGLPADFWGDSDPETLAKLIIPYIPNELHEVTALKHRIALTELDPPIGTKKPGLVLRARVDHLLEAGSLDQAEALMERAAPLSADLFVRSFDVGLLTGRADDTCRTMLANSSLTPSLKARIFCLARAGDWGAAAVTLTTAQALNQITQKDAALLARFLDPELYEDDPAPPVPNPLTALDFVIREALAMPRTGQTLPRAFLHWDLQNTTPWRDRVIATEQLTISQAIPPAALLELYQEGKPAASGGLWVRIAAVQTLLTALKGDDEATIGAALVDAYTALAAVRLEFALADLAADDLRLMTLPPEADAIRLRLWLLHPDYRDITRSLIPQDRLGLILTAIAQDAVDVIQPRSEIERAVVAGFAAPNLQNMVIWQTSQGRKGEMVLKSLKTLTDANYADPKAVETALSVLNVAGLKDEARRLAIQILIRAHRPS